MILIFLMSSKANLPVNGTATEDFFSKKLAHIFEYTILMFLMFRAVGEKSPAKAFLYSLIFAFTDEIHQLFIPTRTGRLRDVGIDSLGLIFSSILIIKLKLWNSYLLVRPPRKPKK
ncbi:MAG: VanZ family protein [Candidatus Collierbacteria bacterium GW2011_GWB2_44_22]|uniref:VanZ family protein n=1 Tax=Candidatus Collierbacteria bacterium GW2011_GWB2_44_22 TaxID=1618387 RepID=A0A0G1HYH6_9BACT|nr:MAG: VanZ family protein [Candidatus Collierbacteria bacterium GW2011_GWB2_44_22]